MPKAKRPVLQTQTPPLFWKEGRRESPGDMPLSPPCLADGGASQFIWAPGGGLWPKMSPFFAQQVSGWWVCLVSPLGPPVPWGLGFLGGSSMDTSSEEVAQNHLLLPSPSTSHPREGRVTTSQGSGPSPSLIIFTSAEDFPPCRASVSSSIPPPYRVLRWRGTLDGGQGLLCLPAWP